MPASLAETFERITASLPDDWSALEFDLRIFDEDRYIQAATFMVICNARPYSRHDWHWRVSVAHRFGHGAAPSAVSATLKLLDRSGIAGELALRRVTSGLVEVEPMWGRPESVRREQLQRRAQ